MMAASARWKSGPSVSQFSPSFTPTSASTADQIVEPTKVSTTKRQKGSRANPQGREITVRILGRRRLRSVPVDLR